jgi:xylulokinase
MFLGEVFQQAFADMTGVPLELYLTDGSIGAAIGAGVGAGYFSAEHAMDGLAPVKFIEPAQISPYEDLYQDWKQELMNNIQQQ